MVVADPKLTAPGARHGEVPENEIRTALVIRVAGEAGEGIKKPGELLIQAAARAGMDVPFSCKSGVCSTCRCKVLEGRVRMDRNFALDKDEIAAGFILSCQAHPLTEQVVISFDER